MKGLSARLFSASNDLAVRRFQVRIGKSISTGEGIRRSHFGSRWLGGRIPVRSKWAVAT